jgi:hypothetical protein
MNYAPRGNPTTPGAGHTHRPVAIRDAPGHQKKITAIALPSRVRSTLCPLSTCRHRPALPVRGSSLETPGHGARGSNGCAHCFSRTQAKRCTTCWLGAQERGMTRRVASPGPLFEEWRASMRARWNGGVPSFSSVFRCYNRRDRRRTPAGARGLRTTRCPSTDVESRPVTRIHAEGLFLAQRASIISSNRLNELPEETRELFALSYVDGLTHSAIAERALDVHPATSERHLARAIVACGGRLKTTTMRAANVVHSFAARSLGDYPTNRGRNGRRSRVVRRRDPRRSCWRSMSCCVRIPGTPRPKCTCLESPVILGSNAS